jgi:hypothetical protein
MRREEDQIMAKHTAPDYGCQYPRAGLRYNTSAFIHVVSLRSSRWMRVWQKA